MNATATPGPGADGPSMSSGGSGLSEAVEALRGRLGRAPASILFLARADMEVGLAVTEAFPGARVTILTKNDFQGMRRRDILKKLRGHRCDLFLLHDGTDACRRLGDLYRLAAILMNARRRFVLAADVRRNRLAPGWSLTEVHPLRSLPGLLWRLLIEALLVPPLVLTTPSGLKTDRRKGDRRIPDPERPLRIAYLRTDFSFGITAGGSVSHISGVSSGLLGLGHTIEYLSSDALQDIDPECPVTVIPPDDRIRIMDEAARIAYHHKFVKTGLARLRERPPDLIYQRHSSFSAAGALLARALGVPLVLEANHSEVAVLMMWSRLGLRDLALKMERCAFANADVIVSVSNNGAAALREYGADPAKILVNPNGVDERRFRPDLDGAAVRARYGFGPGDLVCGFVSTFTRWHGTLFLAEVLADVAARHPEIKFLFIGDGDLRSALETSVESRGLSAQAVFTGLIPLDTVPEHLAACDFFIAPNVPLVDGTPFFMSPVKLFEYMAMGKAVVAADLGQIGEVIEDGENGILFPAGSREGFLAAIDRVAGDPGLRARLGERARADAVARHTWRRNVRRTLEFLDAQLKGKGTE